MKRRFRKKSGIRIKELPAFGDCTESVRFLPAYDALSEARSLRRYSAELTFDG